MRNGARLVLGSQRVRFLLVGAANTIVGYVAFSALTVWVFGGIRFGYLLSLVGSYAIAITSAFLLYRRFVFIVHGHALRDFGRFVTVYLVAIGVNLVLLPAFVEVLGVPALLSQALVLAITTVMSFLGHRTYSFRRG